MDVILVGAGRMGHNLLGLVEDAGWTIPYVLDDQPGDPLLGRPVRDLASHVGPEWDALLSVGEPAMRQRIVDQSNPHGHFRWMTFRHPNAVISRYAELETGAFVGPFTATANAVLGRHAMILSFTQIGSHVRIGAFSLVASHCSINSEAEIGAGCLIGSGARIAAGVRIGEHSRITAGAVVRKDVPPGSLVTADGRFRAVRQTGEL
jgi:sugar O-acyltransferase (sialic acid O-acetyltransferase NeuD family)